MRLDQKLFFVCFCLLSAAIAGNIVYRAARLPEVQFLMPSRGGEWIVPPDPMPGYSRATFTNRFDLSQPIEPCPLEIHAMRAGEVGGTCGGGHE